MFILSINFKNLTVRLHVLIFFILAKFQEDQISIVMLSNKCLGKLHFTALNYILDYTLHPKLFD